MADDLARAIESLNNDAAELTSLDLFSLDIGDEGTEKVAFAIANNTKCIYLSLWSNGIGMKGAEAIAYALQKNKHLTELDLNSNNLGPEGCEAISLALLENSALKKIHLDSNEIGDAGATGIALLLDSNKTLRHIDLHDNGITDEGAEAILGSMKGNSTITHIDVGENKVSEALLKQIEDKAAKNKAESGEKEEDTKIIPLAFIHSKPEPLPADLYEPAPLPLSPPKAAGPAVDLDDYVSMEEFDRLYEDYEALKKKFTALKTESDKMKTDLESEQGLRKVAEELVVMDDDEKSNLILKLQKELDELKKKK